jgi:hypothetical protein
MNADLQAEIDASVKEYRRLIVAARNCVSDNGDYERWNGIAQGIRQTTTRFAEAAGLNVPDWEAIKESVRAA